MNNSRLHSDLWLNERKNKASEILDTVLGVRIWDPDNTYIGQEVIVGEGAVIWPGVFLHGKTVIGQNVFIRPYCIIEDSIIEDGSSIEPYTMIKDSHIGKACVVGPYARLRDGVELDDRVEIGNYVEVKKSRFGPKSKAKHHAYIGDAVIGSEVNIGAGVIFANYDGKKKHQTIVHDKAFIGSNSVLVAPVTIGENALIGAGSTITRNVPANALGIARERQRNREDYNL